MGPLTHAQMAATPSVVPMVDTTSLEVQRDGQVPLGTAVDAQVVGRTSSGVQRGGQVPPGTCDKSQKCPLGGQEVFSVKRHVEMEHLPWYFAPEMAYWICQEFMENRCCLEECHESCLHSLGGPFTEERSLAWLQTMKKLLHELAVLFGLRAFQHYYNCVYEKGCIHRIMEPLSLRSVKPICLAGGISGRSCRGSGDQAAELFCSHSELDHNIGFAETTNTTTMGLSTAFSTECSSVADARRTLWWLMGTATWICLLGNGRHRLRGLSNGLYSRHWIAVCVSMR